MTISGDVSGTARTAEDFLWFDVPEAVKNTHS